MKKVKANYRVRNWKEYDAALKQRGSITFWVSEEEVEQRSLELSEQLSLVSSLMAENKLVDVSLENEQLIITPLTNSVPKTAFYTKDNIHPQI